MSDPWERGRPARNGPKARFIIHAGGTPVSQRDTPIPGSQPAFGSGYAGLGPCEGGLEGAWDLNRKEEADDDDEEGGLAVRRTDG